MPGFSVKKPLTVFVAALAILILGVVAYVKMTPDKVARIVSEHLVNGTPVAEYTVGAYME